jgi:hypothetical protein
MMALATARQAVQCKPRKEQHMSAATSRRRAGTAVAAALAALAAAAPLAQADEVRIGGLCEGHVVSQPLLDFGDASSYLLAPGADFESDLSDFTVNGDAAIQEGNESYDVTGADDSHSLSLPAGSSVTTPPLCVTWDYPSMRMFVRNETKDGKLGVQVVYRDVLTGKTEVKGVGDIDAKDVGGTWRLSRELPTLAGKLGTSLSIRLTAKDKGAWSVDDVLVDPYSRG